MALRLICIPTQPRSRPSGSRAARLGSTGRSKTRREMPASVESTNWVVLRMIRPLAKLRAYRMGFRLESDAAGNGEGVANILAPSLEKVFAKPALPTSQAWKSSFEAKPDKKR